jgi:hypothetical protein
VSESFTSERIAIVQHERPCPDCGVVITASEGDLIEERYHFIRSHSSPAYIYLDWDPAPVLTRFGCQIKLNGAIVHDCGSGEFL